MIEELIKNIDIGTIGPIKILAAYSAIIYTQNLSYFMKANPFLDIRDNSDIALENLKEGLKNPSFYYIPVFISALEIGTKILMSK